MDIETILEMYEDDYNPGSKVPGPRNMYQYGGQIKTGPNKDKYKFMVGSSPQRVEYFDSIEEGKEWEKKTRTKKGYDKPFGKTIPKSELNKGSQYFYNTDFDNLKTDKTLTKEKKKNKVYSKIRDHHRRTGTYKFVVKTQDTEFSKTNQNKILKQFPNAKFGPKRKLGFAPTDAEYDSVFRFVKRGYKKAFPGLPKYMQEELIKEFPYVKFDFTRASKYGVPASDGNLYKKIQTYFDDPKPFRFGFDLRTAGGWTMAQMDRAAALGNDSYEPVLQKPNKPISKTNKIIGMIDKTGKKPKTYNIDTIKNLPNFAEVQKYYDVANLSKTPVSKYSNIVKLLPEGFDPNKILLNDLLQYLSKDKGGINRAKRAIEIHHTKGVRNEATGNFQLLRKDLNKLADTIEQQISKGNLDRSAELTAKGIRVETDGQKFGGRKLSPKGDFKKIVSGVEEDLSIFKKKDFKKLAAALEKAGCGRAAGGRILFSNGTPGGSLTECGKKGVARFINDLKSGNYSKATKDVLKGGGNLIKNIANPKELLKIKNLIGPAALGFMAAWEGGVITDDVIRKGTPLNESLANNWLTKSFLPYTKKYAEAKNLLESGKVPANMKKYVEDVMTYNDVLKDIEGIQSNVESRLVDDGGYGMIDGTSVYTQKQQDKDDENVMKKVKTLTENVMTPGTAKSLEMKSLQDEMEATRMAKKGFSSIFGFDELKDVRTPSLNPGIQDYMSIPEEEPKDFRPITYKDYEKTELPDAERQYYEKKYNIKPRGSLSEYSFPGSNMNALEELTSRYNIRQASKYPGFFSADSEKFSEGGITTLRSKYEYKE